MLAHVAGVPLEELLPLAAAGAGAVLLALRVRLGAAVERRRRVVRSGRGPAG